MRLNFQRSDICLITIPWTVSNLQLCNSSLTWAISILWILATFRTVYWVSAVRHPTSCKYLAAWVMQYLLMQESNLAWSYDRNHLYAAVNPVNYNIFPDKRGGNTTDVPINQNEHLMVWLRPAAKPTLRKLWGRIDQTLQAGKSFFPFLGFFQHA